jgi:hypothetical protein
MSEPKAFASLGPTLLARKGGAKPAMRPQLAALTPTGGAQAAQAIAQDLEDLGWNDMGHDQEPAEPHKAELYALTPLAANEQFEDEDEDFDDPLAYADPASPYVPEPPVVLQQQRAIAEAVARPVREPRRQPAMGGGRRAAFTLRLDAKRHLKLRLASTVKNRSAQQLVTAALDKYLSEIPEIEALAAQVQRD